MVAVLNGNFARIEAAYYQIDLTVVSFRKLMNLTLAWVQNTVSQEKWETMFADAFRYDTLTQMAMDERAPKLKPASGDKRSTIVIPKPDKVVKVGDTKTSDLGLVMD